MEMKERWKQKNRIDSVEMANQSRVRELEREVKNNWCVIRGMKKTMDYEADVRHKLEEAIKLLRRGLREEADKVLEE